MKKVVVIVILSLLCGVSTAQSKSASTAKGGRVPRVTGVMVCFKDNSYLSVIGHKCAYSIKPMESRANAGMTPHESIYVDYENMKYYQMAVLPNGESVTMINTFECNEKLNIVGNGEIDGWGCKIARTVINSNTIDIWYTDNLGYKGTPLPTVGVPDGLVLKITRNGDVLFEAQRADQVTDEYDVFPPTWGKFVNGVDYRHELVNCAVRTVEVFKNEPLHFIGGDAPEDINLPNHTYRVGGGTVLLKKVTLPKNINGNTIFAEVSQYAVGDAYDRTGSIFVIPVGKEKSYLDAMSSKGIDCLPPFISDATQYPGLISTPEYDVPVELMRFFTSFGVRGYNHIQVKGHKWADSVIYKSDVTLLAPMLQGEVWIGAYIGNWDKQGHNLSLKLKYHHGGRSSTTRVIIPLFNTLNILEQAGQSYPIFFENDSLRVEFNLPQNLINAQLVYIATGHGGWGGGDEFNQKENKIYLDGNKLFSFIPWRDDCASYRNLNPASGVFSNGISSSDLSRSNWCPGTVTNPIYIPIGDLRSGTHKLSVSIPQGKPNGNSISYWCISGVIVADIEQ